MHYWQGAEHTELQRQNSRHQARFQSDKDVQDP